MELHCLGTAGYHPNESRHTSCYFLPELGILLDAGSGLFRLPNLIQTKTLDILLSHCHLDHVFGLTFLLDVFYQRPVARLRVWGEAEKLAAVRNQVFSDLLFPVPLEAEWCPVDKREQFEINGARLSWRRQEHPGGSIGYRLEYRDKRFMYLTDTVGDLDSHAIEWASDADLMLHECNFRNSFETLAEKTGHCYSSRLAEVATATAPKKLLIGHFNPLDLDVSEMEDEVRAGYCGELILAEDGMVVGF